MEPNPNTLTQRLSSVHELLDSPLFVRGSPENAPWQAAFAELISQVDELMQRAKQAAKPVVFYEGVGVNGKVQDISMLVSSFRDSLRNSAAGISAMNPRLNRYFGQGTGIFADGTIFTSEYDDEVAFFLDGYRIYLNHHLRRAVEEAENNTIPN